MTLDLQSDAELIGAVRRGDSSAYGVLYERHLYAAKRAAACLLNTSAEREDLVADAFTKVLRALRAGGGPREEFRAYLLVTMRNAAISTARGASVSLYADVPETFLLPRGADDPVLTRWDAAAAADAFASLPERWRAVLWHTEIEDESPADIAQLFGMRPNGVAALAYRAREGLRQAYLRAHLPEVEGRECRATVSKLAGFVRRSTPMPLDRKINRHLARCADCRDRADTLTKVNDELRATVAPLLLGAGFAALYLPTAAPVSGAVVAKTLFAKVGAVLALAVTAVTTVASTPNNPLDDRESVHLPALADPIVSMSTIHGPHAPPAPVAPPVRTPQAATVPVVAPPAASLPAAAEDAKQEAKTAGQEAKQEAKEEHTAAKQEAKEERKAAKEEAKQARKDGK